MRQLRLLVGSILLSRAAAAQGAEAHSTAFGSSLVTPDLDTCVGPRNNAELLDFWTVAVRYDRHLRPGLASAVHGYPGPSSTRDRIEYQMVLTTLQDVDTLHQTFIVHARDNWVWRDHRLQYNSSREGGCLDNERWGVNFEGYVRTSDSPECA